jgi:hypothetical protein
MTHTIRAYHKGKKVYELVPDAYYTVEELVYSLRPRLFDGSADFIEVVDHTNARKTRRIYGPRRNR